ncbi:hypothetical protein QBC40DRAFT_291304 [Triangularia verruculosa]|uniref:Uncharacterized protein n=1 Tax=Triangularia verruculosa TaxID=2587418 RepID=A0AAN6X4Y5_9PEZI|nr:hypothetical protein QBC40DRAFT_291304 [Triangularia verruculosa]
MIGITFGALAAIGGRLWMLGTGTLQGQGDHVTTLCQVHERLVDLYPITQPLTLFEILHLDPYAPPFYPTEASLHPENMDYAKAKSDIVQRATEMASLWYKDQNAAWNKETMSGNKGFGLAGSSSGNNNHAVVFADVAHALYDDDLRGVYIKQFLPLFTSYRWWNPLGLHELGGRREWDDETIDRWSKLATFCGWDL